MMNRKTNNIIFWVTTSLIVIFEGIVPVLTFQTELAKEGIRHLGYPGLFWCHDCWLSSFAGSLRLIFPQIPARIKEWAYAGFAIEFLSASISNMIVDGLIFNSIVPLIVMAVLFSPIFHFIKN